VAQEWLGEHCPDFTDQGLLATKDHTGLPRVGSHVGKVSELKPKPQNVAELKTALLTIRDDLLNETVQKYVLRFRKRLNVCASKLKADISSIRLT